MKNDILNKLWSKQGRQLSSVKPEDIMAKAKKQRKGQYMSIIIMTVTVLILLVYSMYFATNSWNNFTLGLVLMISSLLFRIILEMVTIYKKESRLISMSSKTYHAYLKTHYRMRLLINYIITPACLAIYVYGFYLLLPYFKREFSNAFYNYILISGVLSLIFILGIIINSILKERRFLHNLNKH